MYRKTLSLSDTQIKVDTDRGTFAGYASVFGGVDSYGDTIVRGAYESTLRTNGKPKMFFNHNAMGLPIGKYSVAKEDDYGLFVEGELTAGNSQSEDVRAALKHGTVDGLSIGYWLKKGDYDETDNGRVIRRVHRLAEVSIVTFPADEAARVDLTSVKSEDLDAIETIKDFERFLRDAGGLSNGLAKAITARAKVVFSAREGHGEVDAKAAAELKAMLDRIAGHPALR
jgi:uncharacterized protein